jgi:hypothetical protein
MRRGRRAFRLRGRSSADPAPPRGAPLRARPREVADRLSMDEPDTRKQRLLRRLKPKELLATDGLRRHQTGCWRRPGIGLTEPFATLDAPLSSPLCLAVGLGFAVIASAGRR